MKGFEYSMRRPFGPVPHNSLFLIRKTIMGKVIPMHDDIVTRYGKTESLGSGKYRFKGTDICSDVLEK